VDEVKRRGFFFTVDVFVALSFLVIGFLFIYSAYLNKPASSQTLHYSNDLIDFLANTKINEIDNRDIFRLWCDACEGATHNITNPGNTVLEQMLEFAFYNKTGLAGALANISSSIIKRQFSYRISASLENNSWILAERKGSPAERSRLVIASKDISFILLNNSEFKGPFITIVEVWQ